MTASFLPPGGPVQSPPLSPAPTGWLGEGEEPGRYSRARLLALSDGVFAIALTLLVVSVRIEPGVTAADLPQALRDLRPEFFAYALSVAVIGAFWVNHHRSFRQIVGVDVGLLWLNIAYLGVVAFIPFPTDVLGRYGDQTSAVILYASVIAAAAFLGWCLYAYARGRHLLATDRGTSDHAAARSLRIGAVFAASIPVALWSPSAARAVWIAVIPLGVVSTAARRRRRSGQARPDPGPAPD
jgi:TMEM175 potassium channel family protein